MNTRAGAAVSECKLMIGLSALCQLYARPRLADSAANSAENVEDHLSPDKPSR